MTTSLMEQSLGVFVLGCEAMVMIIPMEEFIKPIHLFHFDSIIKNKIWDKLSVS